MLGHRKAALSSFRLERLHLYELLNLPRWSAAQAVSILAGIHPDSVGKCDGEEWYYNTLPGTLTHYRCDTSNSYEFHRTIMDECKEISGFVVGPSRLPQAWMQEARAQRYEVPWIAFLNEIGCRYLDSKLSAIPDVRSNAVFAATSRHQNSPSHQYKLILLIDWEKQTHPLDRQSLLKLKQRHKEAYQNHMGINWKKGGDRSVDKWFKELENHRRGIQTVSWIDHEISNSKRS